MRTHRTAVGVAGLALVLAGCGGGDDEAASQAVADVFMESGNQVFEVDRDQADCVGDGFVEEIGTDQLVDYGIVTEEGETGDGLEGVEMSEGDAETAAGVLAECADLQQSLSEAMEGQVPEEQQACIGENLTDELLQSVLTAFFRNDQAAATQELTGALGECLTPSGS